VDLANPLVLLLISPVVLAAWYLVRKGVSRPLMISRVIILSLLIIALASPYTIGTTTINDEAPRITVLSDQTMSMDIFNKDTGKSIYNAIKSNTPTTFRQFSGLNSPIGDEVIGAAENNNIVLVSDGNNNYGKDLSDAISLVSNSGTRVFAIRQKPSHNDMSVEITSPKNLIVGNENVLNVIVRQAGNDSRYRLDVEIDGKGVNLAESDITQSERMKTIPVSITFNTLGTHEIKATITPETEDWFNLNNVFYKSVFVVPKPKILALTDDNTTPLSKVANGLYEVTTVSDLPDDLSPYKAVVIDNKGAASLNADALSNYIGAGGGLVVVGGDSSYDKGSYNNSPVEALLPTISRSAEYGGGRNTVIVIDSSGSTSGTDPTTGYSFIGQIDANAINIVQNIARDSKVGVVAFGGVTVSTKMLSMGSDTNRAELETFIRNVGPKGGDNPTDLDKGLRAAEELLSGSGTKEIIVLSDGLMPPEGFDTIKNTVIDLNNKEIKMQFVQVLLSYEKIKEPNKLYNELANAAGGETIVLNPDERASTLVEGGPSETPTPIPTPEISNEYQLAAVDSNHFITKDINITASVTGYNEVIPKLGSDELVATSPGGKPILTTWGFGLGRVASFTTDDGGGLTMWASEVYNGENSRLISGMINWAIGDPRPKEGLIVQAEDIWGGTPGSVLITSDTLPQVDFDGKPLDISRTGPTTYQATINPDKEGFHDLSGYGIAVNYPLEYRDVGFNEQLTSVIESNGGKVYDADGVEGLLLADIKEKATRTVEEPQSQKMPFLIAALVLFLIEVIVRRMKDYRKQRPNIEDNPARVAPVTAAEAGVME
jgi:uncharacterized membrane protein